MVDEKSVYWLVTFAGHVGVITGLMWTVGVPVTVKAFVVRRPRGVEREELTLLRIQGRKESA